MPRFVVWIFSIVAMVLGAAAAPGQSYPAKPIRLITVETGGGADFAARVIVAGLSDSLGQQVVVENRGGAGGAIAIETVARMPPDGYTLLLQGSTLWLLPFLRAKASWDPVKDFAPIAWATKAPNILVVHPSLPVKSVRELIALAKAKPGELSYSSSGTGSSTHIAAGLFTSMAGVNILHIPYKGAGPSLNGLIGGQVHIAFAFAGGAMPHVKSGRLRALAVCSAQPTPLTPGLPTLAATLPGYELVSTLGIFAPAGTPAQHIARLNQAIVQVLNRSDVKERFFTAGAETVGSSPEELLALMTSDMARLGPVIKNAGIRDD